MYFEINVSKNGLHFFATNKRSITSYNQALKLYEIFKKKFKEDEGYEIELTKWETIGKIIDVEEIKKKLPFDI